MAVTVSAAQASNTIGPAMLVDVTGLDNYTSNAAAAITVNRYADGILETLRGADRSPILGAAMSFMDYEAPFTDIQYRVSVTVSGNRQEHVTTDTRLGIGRPWISDPLAPSLAVEVIMRTGSLEEIEESRDGDVLTIVGSTLPIVLGGARRLGTSVPLGFQTRTVQQRKNIMAVLRLADPFLLRTPDSDAYTEIPRLSYFTADTITRKRLSKKVGAITMTAKMVRRPAVDVVIAGYSYANLKADTGTYNGVLALYDEYLGMLRWAA